MWADRLTWAGHGDLWPGRAQARSSMYMPPGETADRGPSRVLSEWLNRKTCTQRHTSTPGCLFTGNNMT